jgi:hypothetical protein
MKGDAWILPRQAINDGHNDPLRQGRARSNSQFSCRSIVEKFDFLHTLFEFVECGATAFERCAAGCRRLDAFATSRQLIDVLNLTRDPLTRVVDLPECVVDLGRETSIFTLAHNHPRTAAMARKSRVLPLERTHPSMRGFTFVMAALAILYSSDRAHSLFFSAPSDARAALETINPLDRTGCRPPPWYRGWATITPFVCAPYWWSPRYYYRGIGARQRWQYRRR